MAIKLSFGKYKGKTIKYIINEEYDYDYLRWLYTQAFVKKNHLKLYKALKRKEEDFFEYEDPYGHMNWYDFFT